MAEAEGDSGGVGEEGGPPAKGVHLFYPYEGETAGHWPEGVFKNANTRVFPPRAGRYPVEIKKGLTSHQKVVSYKNEQQAQEDPGSHPI